MPRKKKGNKKRNRKGKGNDSNDKKAEPKAPKGAKKTNLLQKYNVRVGPVGYEPGPATQPKDIHIDEFKMMDPGGGKTLLDPTELKIVSGMKYGLVGKNGSGKTTLLKLMSTYEIEKFPRHVRMLHVAQEQPIDESTVLHAVLNADEMRTQLEKETDRMEEYQATAPDEEMENVTKVLTQLYEMQENINYDQGEKEAMNILNGLGFSSSQVKSRVCDLSGGWRMRVALAKALFVQPDLLLLDEPTNHLDFPTVLWLQQYLQRYEKSVVVVSHDRTFLNRVVTHIIHLNEKKLCYYKGNYNTFETVRATLLQNRQNEYEKYMLDVREIKAFVEKFQHAGPKRQAQVQSKLKTMAKLELEAPEEPTREKEFAFGFPDVGRLEQPICEMENVTFSWDGPEGTPLLENVSLFLDMDSRIGMIGANGVGKTTIVKLIRGLIQPTNSDAEITVNRQARIAVFTQHHLDQLDLELSAVEFIVQKFAEDLIEDKDRVQTVRRRLGKFQLTGNQQTQQMKYLSGGQKSRVAFCVSTWTKPHFLIMDEPTNHLDIESIDALIEAVRSFHGGVLLISHDQHFLKSVAEEFWAVTPIKIRRYRKFESAKKFSLKKLLPNTKRPAEEKKKKRKAEAEQDE